MANSPFCVLDPSSVVVGGLKLLVLLQMKGTGRHSFVIVKCMIEGLNQ